MHNSLSQSVDNLLHHLRPHGRPFTSFPARNIAQVTRFEPGESIRAWLQRMVTAFSGGDPDQCKLEDNIALFATLHWQRNQLVGANIAALVVSCELTEYLLDAPDNCEEMFLRLDYDEQTLGQPFSHPVPHIHVYGDLSPRFALDGGNAGNVLMDFLEFIYRHYAPNRWRSWAEHTWNQHYFSSNRSPDSNPFPIIMLAFDESQINVLRSHAGDLKKLKQLLRASKDHVFQFGMNGADRELLEYPEAR